MMNVVTHPARWTIAWGLALLLGVTQSATHAQLLDAGESSDGLLGGFGTASAKVTEVAISAFGSAETVAPGGRFVVAVVLDHGEHLHSWPSVDQDVLPMPAFDFAIRTSITPVDPTGMTFGQIQWPEPKPAPVPNLGGGPDDPATVEMPTYKGRAIAYVPVTLADDASGTLTLDLEVNVQACDDTACYQPQWETVSVSVVVEEGATMGPFEGDFAGFDPQMFTSEATFSPDESPAAGGQGSATDSGGGAKFLGVIGLPEPGSPSFLIVTAILGVIGGMVLNLTPCVLPVIPLKVMALSQHAGSPGRSFYLGLWMAIGVVGFWLALAIPVLTVQQFADPSRIFGVWWITGGIGLLIAIMAVGLMGAFNITLPQSVYRINPKADTAWGSFLFGVMTAVLGLPCFGFVIGALLPASANTSDALVLVVFGSMGVGMAAPYLVLAVRPGLLKSIPKAGPGSELVKQVIGLLLLAAAAYFVGSGILALLAEKPHLGKVLHWWVAAIFLAFAGFWLAVRTLQISRKLLPRSVFTVVAILFAAAGFWVAGDQTTQAYDRYQSKLEAQAASRGGTFITTGWNDYSPELLEAAMASDKVVVMDFTAEWCLNCKALKAAVLSKGRVKELLAGEGTIPITVDLTARTAPGWDYLNNELGQTGIPTLAIYGPGLDRPWISNAYTSEQVLAALERAAGTPSALVTPPVGTTGAPTAESKQARELAAGD